jgi:hypothetical protein
MSTNLGISPARSPAAFVEALRQEIARLETARRPVGEAPVSTGCEGLDRLLPAGGFVRGTLVEWIAAGDGSGAETMALFAVREACREGGVLVVLDRVKEFYPPASIRLGIDPERMIVIQAASAVDNLWALDQSLRCPGVAVALAWPEKLDSKTFRRLQLAAEEGASLGFFLRPEQARQTPSWADVRLWIEPVCGGLGRISGRRDACTTMRTSPAGTAEIPSAHRRCLRIQLLRSRGGASGGNVEVEIDDETRTVHLAPRLAHPASGRRAAGA